MMDGILSEANALRIAGQYGEDCGMRQAGNRRSRSLHLSFAAFPHQPLAITRQRLPSSRATSRSKKVVVRSRGLRDSGYLYTISIFTFDRL